MSYPSSHDQSSGSSNSPPTPSSNSQSQQPPSKRRRKPGPVLRACDSCRTQKLRCDKDLPCSHCQRKGVECSYEERGKKSGSDLALLADEATQQQLFTDVVQEADENILLLRQLDKRGTVNFPLAISSGSSTSLLSSPTFAQSTKLWFDHLLSFLGPNRQSSQRSVTFLLNSAMTHSHYHWFDMWHMPTIRRAAYSDREREHVHPALVYGMVAIGLRQRQSRRRAYGIGLGETMIPDEAIQPANHPLDLSEQIKEAANTFLEQDLATPDRDFRSWLDTAKAALMLMQLENEFSPRYLHLLGIARTVLRSTNLQEVIAKEAKKSNNNQFQQSPLQKFRSADVPRSSIEMEEANRLALLPIWLGTRTGITYFNVETSQTGLFAEDMTNSYIFAPWPDGQPEESQRKALESRNTGTVEREEMASNMRAKIWGLNIMYTNFMARSLPQTVDYQNPSTDFQRTIRNLDDMEFMFEMMSEVVDWSEPSYFRTSMIRCCTSVSYLHGAIIRRLGFAHSDAFRESVVAKLNEEELPERKPSSFHSSILRGWCNVQQIYMTEIDLDFISARGQGHLLQLTKFQSDVIRLYWAGTIQFYKGVKKTLELVGLDPETDEVARELNKTAKELAMRIRRHDQATASFYHGLMKPDTESAW